LHDHFCVGWLLINDTDETFDYSLGIIPEPDDIIVGASSQGLTV
jgi:hypothetical protein